MLRALFTSAALIVCAAAPAAAQEAPAVQTSSPYAPFEFLIGEWDAGPAGGAPMFVDRFQWSANRAYIWQSVALLNPEGEHLHFEGPMMWNAATQRLDFLFAIEPGSLGQERGEVYIADDGSFVRDVTLTYGNGRQGTFRHIIRRTGDDTADASMMRQTPEGGWTPEFPGSDRIQMRRRPAT